MKYGQHPLYLVNGLLLCCTAGILSADKITLPAYFPAAASILLLILSVCAVTARTGYAFIIVGLLFAALGFYRYTSSEAITPGNIIHSAGSEKTVTGILQSEPFIRTDDKGIFHIRYEMSALSAGSAKISGGYYLYARQTEPANAQIGDKIAAFGKIRPISSYGNPGRIDNALQARQQGIFAAVSAGKTGLKIEKQPDNMIFLKKVADIRAGIKASMEKVMPKADAAAVFAMLFGGYADIDPDLLESFTATGIVHILSVSGSHITLLAGSIIAAGRILHLKRWMVFFTLMFTVIIYAVFSGLVPPVIRSAAMGILSYAALAFGRESQSRYLLSVVGIFMLIISPGLIFNVSFQLSFAATAGLLYAAPVFRTALHFLPEYLSLPLSITLGAQLLCLPFLSWYFHSLSLSSLLANIIAVPLIDIIIVSALAAVIINFILPFISSVVFVLCSLLLGLAYETAKFLSLLPLSTVYLPYMTLPGSILYYLLCIIVLHRDCRSFCEKKIKAYRSVFFALLCLLLTFLTYSALKEHDAAIHFIDVGQGDAALIITPHKKAVMIDTGGIRDSDYDIGKRVDVPYLYHYGVTHLDYIFLSHAHEDHAGGVGGILEKIPADGIFIGREGPGEYASVWRISPQSDIMNKVIPLKENQSVMLDGIRFDILHLGAPGETGDANETSAVIKMTYKNFSALFTGDLPAQEEAALLRKNGGSLACTVLKVAHHGSKTSSTKEFLERAHPRWAVISVSAGNSYGHPDSAVLTRLNNAGAAVYRTDKNGAVVFRTDGKKCTVSSYIE